MNKVEQLIESFRRFKHYMETFDGVYIYPEYHKDLKVIINFIGTEYFDADELSNQIPNSMI